jgi:polyisoprenyl-phosphate glycosyltransferase
MNGSGSEASAPGGSRLVVLVPVFNDWEALGRVIPELDRVLASEPYEPHLLLVDDGSSVPRPPEFLQGPPLVSIREVEHLRLRRNVGHQRAIAIGLAYVHAHLPCKTVLVMDGDGEDRPSDVTSLLRRLEECDHGRIVFAERTRRSEGLVFSSFYHLYRLLHRLLTGYAVRVGNFSVVPGQFLEQLVVTSELWSHYAASVFRSAIPYVTVPAPRGTRVSGKSHMNFVSLAVHGLSAISLYGDIVGVRLLMAASACILVLVAGLGVVVGVRLFTERAIPGWATYAAGILAVMLIQILLSCLALVVLTLGGRVRPGFLPVRDHSYFISHSTKLSLRG